MKKHLNTALLSVFLAVFAGCIQSHAVPEKTISIIPEPAQMQVGEGCFEIKSGTEIAVTDQARSSGRILRDYLAPATGFALPIKTDSGQKNAIRLFLSDSKNFKSPEAYKLTADRHGIEITASSEAGLFYGIQTLRQLLPVEIFSSETVRDVKWCVPAVSIEDAPAFTWRGMHLDVSRHFMPAEFIKKYIDLLALHKMNIFHWHLTDDQGWRIEIKKYPKLTEVGAWRKETLIGHARKDLPHKFDNKPHGGFYTQDQVREIVEYARRRHVTIVPEIEMPGHSQAAIAAYPELGNTGRQLEVMTKWGSEGHVFNVEESTISFLQDILTEVMELFPSPYIHVGGDEVRKDEWKDSPRAQQRMKDFGLADEDQLQSWFIKRMDTFLAEHGRRLVGWDEILEGGLAPGAVVMSWRGEKGGIAAAKAGHDVIMASSGFLYFDHYQADPETEPLAIHGFNPLDKVYNYHPVPSELSSEEAKHVLGAQGQIWTEYIATPEHAEYMAYPRACALAELVWTPKEKKDYDEFFARLRTHLKRLDALDVNYRPLDKKTTSSTKD